jgi:hypothetical protein
VCVRARVCVCVPGEGGVCAPSLVAPRSQCLYRVRRIDCLHGPMAALVKSFNVPAVRKRVGRLRVPGNPSVLRVGMVVHSAQALVHVQTEANRHE